MPSINVKFYNKEGCWMMLNSEKRRHLIWGEHEVILIHSISILRVVAVPYI